MKPSTFIIILAIVACVIGFAACKTSYQTEDNVALLDVTEPDFIHVSSSSLKENSSIKINPNNGIRTQLSTLTEMAYNPVEVLAVAPITRPLLANEYERKQEIKKYHLQLDSLINGLGNNRMERDGSVIYQTIAREINAQAKRKADIKNMIINSDLREHSELMDFYESNIINAVVKDMDSTINLIIPKLEKAYPLEDLSGITVHLIYQPRTALQSKRFNFTSALYKRMLESHGAKVMIGANLISE